MCTTRYMLLSTCCSFGIHLEHNIERAIRTWNFDDRVMHGYLPDRRNYYCRYGTTGEHGNNYAGISLNTLPNKKRGSAMGG